MPKSKKFIDRKNAVTFHLVHRSQQDPLTADENAPKRVLLPVQDKTKDDPTKRKEEQKKFGVFFDDDYNYLQHLKDTSTTVVWEKVETPTDPKTKLKLPSSVFASVVEEDVGLLNKAAPHRGPRLDLDPDVVAAMDEDFDFNDPNNELEDNFMELANADAADEEEGDYTSDDNFSDYSNEARDEVCSLDNGEFDFNEEETKSRFTEYSMSSSVMRRNDQLTLLDDRFEKMYTQMYDDNEIGDLECEEIEGFVDPNSEIMLKCAEEFEKQRQLEKLDENDEKGHILKLMENVSSDDSDSDELVAMDVTNKNKEKWDCESILSTYSNIYNHPKLISEPKKNNNQKIKINMRTGMPENILGSNKLTAKALSQFNEENTPTKTTGPKSNCEESILSILSTLSVRPKDETPEERKDRKKQLKDYRKQRRIEKKINTEAFREENKRQVKIAINNKNNVQGNRIL